ncbi:MAG: DUF2892 domain-containing protein [Armatimonadetes bacterium]|nr:DUF2892 domain-containing protein [Armatimonadota bacterium]
MKNVGSTDRAIRIVAGLGLVGTAIATKMWWLLIGIVPLLTGIFSFCPAYVLFKTNTCGLKKAE